MDENDLSKEIIAACIEVHKALGPGLLESAYEACLCHELTLRDLRFKRQFPIGIKYKNVNLDCGFRLDIIAEDKVIIEIKAVEKIMPVHKKQLLTYLKLADKRLGLLINFNEQLLMHGIYRVVNGLRETIT